MSEDPNRYGRHLREAAEEARKLPRGQRRSEVLRAEEVGENRYRLGDQLAVLARAGDTLQSAASRMASWLYESEIQLPYEVVMAALEARRAVEDWTDARNQAERSEAPDPSPPGVPAAVRGAGNG